jgi:hypothetical protein
MSIKGPHGAKLFKAYASDSLELFTLNEVVEVKPDQDGENFGEFVFAQAGEALDAGALCIVAHDGQATECDTTASGSTRKRLGIAQVALANDEYGWFWRGRGKTEALVADSVAAGAALTTTATDGVLGAGGDAIASLVAVDANASGDVALTTVFADGYISSN